MNNANHATKAKQNLDVVNETIGMWLLFGFCSFILKMQFGYWLV
jgi:hypothetical protein